MAQNREGRQVSTRQTRSGKQEITTTALKESPFPLATEISGYEQAISGSGTRLIDIIERQQQQAYDVYKDERRANTLLTVLGQILIFIAVMAALGIAGYVGIYGNWVAASVIGFVPTALVAGLTYTGLINRLRK